MREGVRSFKFQFCLTIIERSHEINGKIEIWNDLAPELSVSTVPQDRSRIRSRKAPFAP
jgi:hypothetical protein